MASGWLFGLETMPRFIFLDFISNSWMLSSAKARGNGSVKTLAFGDVWRSFPALYGACADYSNADTQRVSLIQR